MNVLILSLRLFYGHSTKGGLRQTSSPQDRSCSAIPYSCPVLEDFTDGESTIRMPIWMPLDLPYNWRKRFAQKFGRQKKKKKNWKKRYLYFVWLLSLAWKRDDWGWGRGLEIHKSHGESGEELISHYFSSGKNYGALNEINRQAGQRQMKESTFTCSA